MKTPVRLFLSALIMLLTFSLAYAQTINASPPAAGADIREKIAAEIADNYAKKDYVAVRKDFAKTMLDAISVEKIKDTWESLTAKIGEYQKVVSTKEVQLNGYNVIRKRCQFASENATIQVTFNEENKVIGLLLKL